jgi:fatty acid desaturase
VNILDRIPAPIRHAVIGLVAAIITYAAANYTTWGLPAAAYPILGAIITVLGLWVTPFTSQYGVGSSTSSTDIAAPVDTATSVEPGA